MNISRNLTRLVFLILFSLCSWLMVTKEEFLTIEFFFISLNLFIGILFGFSINKEEIKKSFFSFENLIKKIIFIILISSPFVFVEQTNNEGVKLKELTQEFLLVDNYYSSQVDFDNYKNNISSQSIATAIKNTIIFILTLIIIPMILSVFDNRWGYFNVVIGICSISALLMLSGPMTMNPTTGMKQPIVIDDCSSNYTDSWEGKSQWERTSKGWEEVNTRLEGSISTYMSPTEFKYNCDASLDPIRDTDIGSCRAYSRCISAVKYNRYEGSLPFKILTLDETLKFLNQNAK